MKNKLELVVKTFLTTAMIVLCIIIFSSCTTPKVATDNNSNISYQRIIIDSLGIHEVLPQQKGLRK